MELEVKNLPVIEGDIREVVQSLGQEDPLEEGMATLCSILSWRVHEQRCLVGYGPQGHKESDTTEVN